MNNRLSLLAIALIALALAAPLQAQETPATLTLSGTVVSSSPTSLAVRAEDGSQKTFMVDSRSTMPADLARGSRVTVTYETSGDQMRAVSVTSADAEPRAGADPMPGAAGTTDPDRLPATASPLPLVALLGALAVAGGLALRAVGRRSA